MLFNFLDPATPIAERIINIHHHVFFFLIIVLIFVVWIMYRILFFFWFPFSTNTKLNHKDLIIFNFLARLKSTHNTWLEIIWTMIPTIILVAIALPSFGLLYAMDDVVDPDMTLKVIGHQWYWSYEWHVDLTQYEKLISKLFFNVDTYMLTTSELIMGDLRLLEVDNVLFMPINTHIRVNITSSDVLHCWAVPSFGTKVDAVPNRINAGIIFLQRTGTFFGQCSEICGVNHGFMPIKIDVWPLDVYFKLFTTQADFSIKHFETANILADNVTIQNNLVAGNSQIKYEDDSTEKKIALVEVEIKELQNKLYKAKMEYGAMDQRTFNTALKWACTVTIVGFIYVAYVIFLRE